MAWGAAGKPTHKTCPGYGCTPHDLRYDDFPQNKRCKKDGTTVYYAGTYCHTCRQNYDREIRRMRNRLAGRATRPQDVSWNKYRKKIPSAHFLRWLKHYLKTNQMPLKELCTEIGITTRPVRRWRQFGYISSPHTAELFLKHAGQEHRAQSLLWQYIETTSPRVAVTVDAAPFLRWLRKYQMSTGKDLETICHGARVAPRSVRRIRATGRMRTTTADKFFVYAKEPHLLRVMYPEAYEGRKAA